MKKTAFTLLCGIFIFIHDLFPAWIPIPLGIEDNPSGHDSYLPYRQIIRPRIGLALSGGGARGLAQIGVLKVLEKHSIPIDGIAGTSMGAIIGGLYSVGYSAVEIESLAYQIRWDELLSDSPPRQQLFLGQKAETSGSILQLRLKGFSLDIPSALTAGQKLTSLLTNLILESPSPVSQNFMALPVPLCIVSTDLVSGSKVLLTKGALVDAMRASMGIPLLFTPVVMDTALLVDGGIIQNLPVSELDLFSPDLLIAVDTSSKLRSLETLRAPWEIADQVTTIMQRTQVQEELDKADIPIQIDLPGFSNMDFSQIETIIQKGEQAALSALPQLEKYLTESQSHDSTLKIDQIEFSGLRHLSQQPFLDMLSLKPGTLSISQIVWSGQSLLQTGYFQRVLAYLDTSNNTLLFELEENPFVQEIQFHGNTVLSDSILLSNLKFDSGVINLQKGKSDLRRILSIYKEKGYVLAHIDSVSLRTSAILNIYIHEGRIGSINLSGNSKTKPIVILRELPFRTGDKFNVQKMHEGIENVFSTRLFESVRFRVVETEENYDIIIHVIEQGSTLVRSSLRYDLEHRTQGSLEILEENVFGYGGKMAFQGSLGRRDESLSFRFWSDRLFQSLFTYQLRFGYLRSLRNDYQNFTRVGTSTHHNTEGSILLGRQMARLGTLSLGLKSESISIHEQDGIGVDESYVLRNLTLRSEVDTRNKLPFPTKGEHHILEYETASLTIASDIPYTKLFSSMEVFAPISKEIVFHPKFSWGAADRTIPFAKQFFVGGLFSFAGLPERALYGKRFFILNAECIARIPFIRGLETHMHIRYDMGGVWKSFERILLSDFMHGFCFILSMKTPVGPFYFAYGTMDQRQSSFYMSLGYPF